MSRREDIDNAIWSDPSFADLTAQAKLVYLWSFTNPLCGMSGIYKVGPRTIAFEANLSADATESALRELEDRAFIVRNGHTLWVRARVKHLRTRTPQMARSIANDLGRMANDHPVRTAFLTEYDESWTAENWESLGEQLRVIEPEDGWQVTGFVSPKARMIVMERDGNRCCACGATEDLVIDHIKPRSHGGSGKVENLQVLCNPCNIAKGPRDKTLEGPTNSLDPPIDRTDPPMNLGEVPGLGLRQRSSSETVGSRVVDARVRELFDYWREQCNHPAAKLTAERRRKIAARLHEGYSPEQVREGIDGAARAPFINEQGNRFDDIELVCRNGTKLEQFIGRTAPAGRTKGERARDDLAALTELMGGAA